MLYQLSYSHHAAAPGITRRAGRRTNDSHITARRVDGFPAPAAVTVAQSSAAIALAASTSGPGCGTKTVRR